MNLWKDLFVSLLQIHVYNPNAGICCIKFIWIFLCVIVVLYSIRLAASIKQWKLGAPVWDKSFYQGDSPVL